MTTVEASSPSVRARTPAFIHAISTNRFQFCSQLVAIIAVISYVAWLLSAPYAHTHSSDPLADWLTHLAVLSPAVPIFARGRTHSTLRGAWFVMGLGVLLFNLAGLVGLIRVAAVARLLTPTLRDVIFVLSFCAVAVAVVVVTQQSFGRHANSVRLDGIIAGLSMAALASTYWFKADIEISGRPLIAELNIFNPILVLVLLVLLLAGLVPRRFRVDTSTAFLIAAMTVFAAGDLIQLNRVAPISHISGALVDASRPVGLCCLALAAWPRLERRAEARGSLVAPRGVNLIPVIFGTLSIAILADSVRRPTSESTKFMALGSLLLVILRMVMTQGEARQLGRSSFVEARTDHVTGLANRRAFLEDGESMLASLRAPDRLAIALIDLDGFKEVNDSIGHAYGDELLKIVGRRFASKVADRGSVARLGGDEFALTFVVGEGMDPLAVARELAHTLAGPVSLDGTKVRVSASIGLAIWPQHGSTHAELLRSADVAMYEAKRSHAAVCAYRDEIDVNSRERLSLINELRTAIDRRRLTLHFQPTRDVRSGEVHGVEALVRWRHPTLGLLQPDDFIPLAERVGMITPLTRAVLDLAIAELVRLDHNGNSLQMNVNISQWDLMDPYLPEAINSMLKWNGVAAERITLEVTESCLGHDPALTKRSLERLRSLGVKISIDDFGVGYSSMSQLLELPVDQLKIDKSFAIALDSDARAISLISSMIEMARSLNLEVIAEGVESSQNYEALRNAGADIIQGDYVARPLSSSQLDHFLAHARGDQAYPGIDFLPALAEDAGSHIRLPVT